MPLTAPDPVATPPPNETPPLRLEAVGEKLAGVLHDLGGPLSVISGFSELIADEPDLEVRRELAAEVLRQVQRITQLRDQTLAYARGKGELLKHTVQLHAFRRAIFRAVEGQLAGTSIRFEVVLGYGGPAQLDEEAILRVVENLTRNAREAMGGGTGSHFDVTIDRQGDQLVLSFSDDGPGIAPEIRARLFERFSTWGKTNGTGLGLFLVQQTARDHGGEVRCFSVSGHGARFEMRLPLADPVLP